MSSKEECKFEASLCVQWKHVSSLIELIIKHNHLHRHPVWSQVCDKVWHRNSAEWPQTVAPSITTEWFRAQHLPTDVFLLCSLTRLYCSPSSMNQLKTWQITSHTSMCKRHSACPCLQDRLSSAPWTISSIWRKIKTTFACNWFMDFSPWNK